MKLGILSGYYPGFRFESHINHRAYADANGYYYIYNFQPELRVNKYHHKISTILRYMDLFDWIFWIDDDAFFTDFSTSLEKFLPEGDTDFIVCKSPDNKAIYTKISSGQFLLRSTPRAKAFLSAVLRVDLMEVKKYWREDLGFFSKGDQDAMIYLMETQREFDSEFYKILHHSAFNSRPYEYTERLDEHFLVHFVGKNRPEDFRLFCERVGVDKFVLPAGHSTPVQ